MHQIQVPFDGSKVSPEKTLKKFPKDACNFSILFQVILN